MASYSRYSSESQREESITDQQRKFQEQAAQNGHTDSSETLVVAAGGAAFIDFLPTFDALKAMNQRFLTRRLTHKVLDRR